MKPHVIAILPAYIPSTIIGVYKPLMALKKRGVIHFSCYLEHEFNKNNLNKADIVIFCRNTEPQYNDILFSCLKRNIPTIYELDDNLWEIPSEYYALREYHSNPARIKQLETYIQTASLVRVYNPILYEKISTINPKTKLLKAGIDFNTIQPRNKISDTQEIIRIAYPTSRLDDNLYKIFVSAIKSILQSYSNVEFTIWGKCPQEFIGMRGVRSLPRISNYDQFLKSFSIQNFDIGLAPMIDEQFYHCKTNNKYREFGACQIAGIYSKSEPYISCIEHEQNGLLVNNNGLAWEEAMRRLINQTELRQNIQKNAFQNVYEEYRQELSEIEWQSEIRQILDNHNTNWNFYTGRISIESRKMNANGIQISFPIQHTGFFSFQLFSSSLNNLLRSGFVQFTNVEKTSLYFSPITNSAGIDLSIQINLLVNGNNMPEFETKLLFLDDIKQNGGQ